MYKAVKHLDFYYLVEEYGDMYPDYIQLTEEEYTYFLRQNQEHGHQIRMSKGELISCEVSQPSPDHFWDEVLGEWAISEEVRRDWKLVELTDKYNSLKQEMVFEGLMDRDTSKLRAELLLIEAELKELEASMEDEGRRTQRQPYGRSQPF